MKRKIKNERKKNNMPKQNPWRVVASVSATGRLGSGSGPESKLTKAGPPGSEGSVGCWSRSSLTVSTESMTMWRNGKISSS